MALMVCFNQPAIDQDLHPERRTFAPVVLPALLSTYRSARAPYNFVDDKKVKRISVNALVRNKLSSGSLAIVHHGGGYEIIPREAALKIQERDPRRIVLLNTPTEAPDADDPYAAYQVPDDLMW